MSVLDTGDVKLGILHYAEDSECGIIGVDGDVMCVEYTWCYVYECTQCPACSSQPSTLHILSYHDVHHRMYFHRYIHIRYRHIACHAFDNGTHYITIIIYIIIVIIIITHAQSRYVYTHTDHTCNSKRMFILPSSTTHRR